jgi:hypothetical protein
MDRDRTEILLDGRVRVGGGMGAAGLFEVA